MLITGYIRGSCGYRAVDNSGKGSCSRCSLADRCVAHYGVWKCSVGLLMGASIMGN